jgi:hypothetical protein
VGVLKQEPLALVAQVRGMERQMTQQAAMQFHSVQVAVVVVFHHLVATVAMASRVL